MHNNQYKYLQEIITELEKMDNNESSSILFEKMNKLHQIGPPPVDLLQELEPKLNKLENPFTKVMGNSFPGMTPGNINMQQEGMNFNNIFNMNNSNIENINTPEPLIPPWIPQNNDDAKNDK